MKDNVETAVADGHRYIELNPDAAVGYELLGRAAKYRGEPDWQELLKLAADRYAVEGRMQSLHSAANLYRLTGHNELAEKYWEQLLAKSLQDYRYSRMSGEWAMIAAYFLDDDEQFDAVCDEVRVVDQAWWESLSRIRAAHKAGDRDVLASELAKWVTHDRGEPIVSNGVNPSAHDMMEHITELLAGL